jgi:hypothetical protein
MNDLGAGPKVLKSMGGLKSAGDWQNTGTP